jgi:hypothetical protein
MKAGPYTLPLILNFDPPPPKKQVGVTWILRRDSSPPSPDPATLDPGIFSGCAQLSMIAEIALPRRAASVGGGVRIHPDNARMSGRHGVQYVAQCVACAALTLVVWQ